MYYEKYVENGCFLLLQIPKDKKFKEKIFGFRSKINRFEPFYELSIYDHNN